MRLTREAKLAALNSTFYSEDDQHDWRACTPYERFEAG